MTITRRELDAKLHDLENKVLNLTTALPSMLRDVQDLRAALQLPPNGEETPEQPQGGTA